jgi:hypothetical protein
VRSGGRSSDGRVWCAAVVTAAVALSAALGGCANWGGAAASPACRAGAPECPIELVFTANHTEVSGTLSPEHSSVSYAFDVNAPAQFQWSLSGPAVRIVLTGPDGDADGPGLAASVPLVTAGRYVFSLSSNTMAEDIYGAYRLNMRLSP